MKLELPDALASDRGMRTTEDRVPSEMFSVCDLSRLTVIRCIGVMSGVRMCGVEPSAEVGAQERCVSITHPWPNQCSGHSPASHAYQANDNGRALPASLPALEHEVVKILREHSHVRRTVVLYCSYCENCSQSAANRLTAKGRR